MYAAIQGPAWYTYIMITDHTHTDNRNVSLQGATMTKTEVNRRDRVMRDGVCPECGHSDLSKGQPEPTTTDLQGIAIPVECCQCSATFVILYNYGGIDE